MVTLNELKFNSVREKKDLIQPKHVCCSGGIIHESANLEGSVSLPTDLSNSEANLKKMEEMLES